MARSAEMNELTIVFIYDRFRCRREEDDPKDSILYFHPSSISVEKRVAICGQLMGVSHFFTDTMSFPKILTLANGKFALRNFDEQYVLAIGRSSVTSDFLLEKEADILMSVIKFFHCDIKAILRHSNYDRALVSTKLTAMMDHYIPVSQQHGDLFSLTFGILPILHLPKSANNISLQASVLVQTCMLKKGVLGGIVMYQNKVVGVELGQSLAQKLAFTQPYRMPPADLVKLEFKLPIGVQIFRVYISDAEFEELRGDCSKFQNPQAYREFGPMKPKNEQKSRISKNQIKGELNLKELNSKCGDETSDISSGIHSDETGREFHGFNSIQDEKNSRCNLTAHGNHRLNGFKCEPRRCQSVVDLHYDTEFGSGPQPSRTNPSSPIKQSSSIKQLGVSVADPTFPYFTPNGRHSVSSAFHNSHSTDTSVDDEDRRLRQDEFSSNENSQESEKHQPVASTPLSAPPMRRPIDLPIAQHTRISGPQRIKKKLWATFNELISPIDSVEPTFENLLNGNESSKINLSLKPENPILERDTDFQKGNAKPTLKIPESIHLRLLNSFRRLSSHEEALDESGDGDGEYSNSFSASNSTCSETENTQMTSVPSQNSEQFSGFRILTNPSLKVKRAQHTTRSKPVVTAPMSSEIPRKEVALYIYYDGSMRLLLLLDKKDESDQNLIESIWEYVASSLVQLKMSLSTVEEQSSFSNQSDPYCFLRYESIWKSMAHGGRNESMDFNTVQIMHRDFTRHPNINELIIRGDDHVVYGYQCVGSEVYYQQRAGLQPGLPMPSDLMGKVPLKAKRRLERDHSIVLL